MNEKIMPEMPEVESVRRFLSSQCIGKYLKGIDILDSKLLKCFSNREQKSLLHQKIETIQRRGKYLIFIFENEKHLCIHLRMSGQLFLKTSMSQYAIGGFSFLSHKSYFPNTYTRAIFTLSDRTTLYFDDMRRFGTIHLCNVSVLEEKLGIEPLTKDFTLDNFQKLFQEQKTTIKQLLLNQEKIAGIGNIYADEVCFDCSIDPSRSVKDINSHEQKALFFSIENILRNAIEMHGTSFQKYRKPDGNQGSYQEQLQIFRRDGEQCYRCNTIIEKKKIGGRGTHFYPQCQF